MTERSEKQRQASRANGAKSKGPTSDEGKAKSSKNALKHGGRATEQTIQNLNAQDIAKKANEIRAIVGMRGTVADLLIRGLSTSLFQLQNLHSYSDMIMSQNALPNYAVYANQRVNIEEVIHTLKRLIPALMKSDHRCCRSVSSVNLCRVSDLAAQLRLSSDENADLDDAINQQWAELFKNWPKELNADELNNFRSGCATQSAEVYRRWGQCLSTFKGLLEELCSLLNQSLESNYQAQVSAIEQTQQRLDRIDEYSGRTLGKITKQMKALEQLKKLGRRED